MGERTSAGCVTRRDPPATDAGGASHRRAPWLRRRVPPAGKKQLVERELLGGALRTVCAEARCPNRCECYARGTATFLIMGDTCTRSCSFCGVAHGVPGPLDNDEPARVLRAVKELALSYVVLTSVTRDDLPDQGAGHFAATVSLLKRRLPGVRVECLVPDFRGDRRCLDTVLASGPDVFNHNIETAPRLYPAVRPQAAYRRSLDVLEYAAASATTKSGLMVGLGETPGEVVDVMKDLRRVGCSIVTIGQYLRPTARQAAVRSFVTPGQFDEYRKQGLELGFARVEAGPFVRSSYRADACMERQ